jgi:hypothetical protein
MKESQSRCSHRTGSLPQIEDNQSINQTEDRPAIILHKTPGTTHTPTFSSNV